MRDFEDAVQKTSYTLVNKFIFKKVLAPPLLLLTRSSIVLMTRDVRFKPNNGDTLDFPMILLIIMFRYFFSLTDTDKIKENAKKASTTMSSISQFRKNKLMYVFNVFFGQCFYYCYF